MDVTLNRPQLKGKITAPPSKSAAHRAVICAALADGTSEVTGVGQSEDIKATLDAVAALGATVVQRAERYLITGIKAGNIPRRATLDCRESGSTLRFLLPVAAALGVDACFTGAGRLPLRPITPYMDCLQQQGILTDYQGTMPFVISGKLKAGEFRTGGDLSSQFISGLLFALPLLEGDSKILLTTPLASAPYVDMTLDAVIDFGIWIDTHSDGYSVKGGQRYRPRRYKVEGDYSGAAFFLAAGALGNRVTVDGLDLHTKQGDAKIVELLQRFGAQVKRDGTQVEVSGGRLHGQEIDAGHIPDLVPILAVVAAVSEGITRIYNAGRLRIKESDRLEAIAQGLNRLGGNIQVTSDGLNITGVPNLQGGEVDAFGDHRIAMALSIASLCCKQGVTIRGAQCIDKSYPGFYGDFEELAGEGSVIYVGK